jgi:hypothetical protein
LETTPAETHQNVEDKGDAEVALERDLEDTFPTSDPSSSWAGPDIKRDVAKGDESSKPLPDDGH